MIELPVTLTSTGGAVSFASPVPLGYTKNKGVYRLLVTAEGEWEGLTIRCFWHLPGGADPASSLVQDGAVDVPASVTAHPGNGCITFEGSDGVKTVTSADLRYRVGSNSGTEDGTMPEPGTPAWEQLVSETAVALEAVQKQIGNLDDLTTKAKETLVAAINEAARTGSGVAGSITMRTDGGYIQYSTDDGSTWENLIALDELKGEPGKNGADGDPGADGYSPTASVEQSADGAKITITDKRGTTEAVVKNGKDGANGRDGADGQPGRDGTDGAPGRDGVDGQPGKDGKDGITPTIGDNGNWYLGGTDTGKPSRGADGATGEKGTDGKSAYQYAQDGGYTGTEAEFAAKLAEEMPGALPNPNALTFMGAATGTYDGSAPLTVNIPAGGSGTGGSSSEWELLTDITLTEASAIAEVRYDNKYKMMYAYFEIPKVEEKISTGKSICLLHRYTVYYASIGDPKYSHCIETICNATNQSLLEFFCIRLRNGVGVFTPWEQRNSPISSNSCLPFRIYSSIELPAGTVLRVYGRE